MAVSTERRVKTYDEPLSPRQIEIAGDQMLEHFRQDVRDVGLDLEFFENRIRNLMRTPTVRMLPSELEIGLTPPVDLEETPTSYLVRTNLPGVPKDKVEIRFWGQNLDLKATTEAVKETETKNYVYRERSGAHYRRRVTFPTPIVPTKAEANLDSGILTVTVPKLEPGEEHRIRIR